MKMKLVRWVFMLVAAEAMISSTILAQESATNSVTPLQQAMADYQQSLVDTVKSPGQSAYEKAVAAREKIIKMAAAMDQLPPIPEDARKHFVAGATLFKEAKTADDFTKVEFEFGEACRLAPWWPEARYNHAMVFVFAGDYDNSIQDFVSAANFYRDALANLKSYQLFKLSDAEARTVQDKIYELETKQQKAVAAKAEEQRLADKEAKAKNFNKKLASDVIQWLQDNYSGRVAESFTLISFPKGHKDEYANQWHAGMTPDFKSHNLLSLNWRFAFTISGVGDSQDQITIDGPCGKYIGAGSDHDPNKWSWMYVGDIEVMKKKPLAKFEFYTAGGKPVIESTYEFSDSENCRAEQWVLEDKK